jgi:hypothetical protein
MWLFYKPGNTNAEPLVGLFLRSFRYGIRPLGFLFCSMVASVALWSTPLVWFPSACVRTIVCPPGTWISFCWPYESFVRKASANIASACMDQVCIVQESNVSVCVDMCTTIQSMHVWHIKLAQQCFPSAVHNSTETNLERNIMCSYMVVL